MRPVLLGVLVVCGLVGVWLAMWDIADFLTTGINRGIWDLSILTTGFPSIMFGIFIIIVVSTLGVTIVRS